MSELPTTRRAVLKAAGALGTVAILAAHVAFLPEANAASVDPVFAAIALHAAARKRINAMGSQDDGWDAALDEEEDLWKTFCACRPVSIDGLAAYAAHAATYPDLAVLIGRDGPAEIISNMAETLRVLREEAAR